LGSKFLGCHHFVLSDRFLVKVLGPPKAAELMEALAVVVKQAVTLAQHPMSGGAGSRKTGMSCWIDWRSRVTPSYVWRVRIERTDRLDSGCRPRYSSTIVPDPTNR